MCLIGKGQQFLVTSAITIGGKMVVLAMGIERENTIHLLLTITVFREETAR